MTALRLIVGENRFVEFGASPMRLDERSRRPGVAHEELTLALDRELAGQIARGARADGLPLALWATIAIESERALAASSAGDQAQARLALHLDAAAERDVFQRGLSGRLDAYCAALRDRSAPPRRAGAPRSLGLLVPYHSLRAWQIAAERADCTLEDWARARLAQAAAGRGLWEAAAAAHGQMLAEWVALGACGS